MSNKSQQVLLGKRTYKYPPEKLTPKFIKFWLLVPLQILGYKYLMRMVYSPRSNLKHVKNQKGQNP